MALRASQDSNRAILVVRHKWSRQGYQMCHGPHVDQHGLIEVGYCTSGDAMFNDDSVAENQTVQLASELSLHHLSKLLFNSLWLSKVDHLTREMIAVNILQSFLDLRM